MEDYREQAMQLFKETVDKFHRDLRAALEVKKAGGNPEKFEVLGHNLWDGVFFSRIPDVAIDYFVNPYIKIIERGHIHPRTMALCLLTSYLSREPKDKHGIMLWSMFAKECGASEEEILECGALAMISNGKCQMVSIEDNLSEVFASPEFKNTENKMK